MFYIGVSECSDIHSGVSLFVGEPPGRLECRINRFMGDCTIRYDSKGGASWAGRICEIKTSLPESDQSHDKKAARNLPSLSATGKNSTESSPIGAGAVDVLRYRLLGAAGRQLLRCFRRVGGWVGGARIILSWGGFLLILQDCLNVIHLSGYMI